MNSGIPWLEQFSLGQIGAFLLILLIVQDYARRHVWSRLGSKEGAPGESRQAGSPKEGSLANKAGGAGD